jgi:hypothetical protein
MRVDCPSWTFSGGSDDRGYVVTGFAENGAALVIDYFFLGCRASYEFFSNPIVTIIDEGVPYD